MTEAKTQVNRVLVSYMRQMVRKKESELQQRLRHSIADQFKR